MHECMGWQFCPCIDVVCPPRVLQALDVRSALEAYSTPHNKHPPRLLIIRWPYYLGNWVVS